MKIKSTLLFLFLLLFSYASNLICAEPQQNNSDDEWYPFSFPAKLDPDSPANIGKLVLDAPAGKHGFVKVKDGHFYFEDGTRAKFWGTNLSMFACFPTHKQAELIADRLAFFGFNAIRFAHLDYAFEPQGIFEDIAPAFKNKQLKKTGKLSTKQLDRLDYLIYQLKTRGIYIDFILLCSRFFTEADGIKNTEEIGMAAKPVSMFSPHIIKLQKEFTHDLLTHYNPYTKLRYCDDPAISMLEITNENSIIARWKSNELNGSFFGIKKHSITDYYVNELDHLWNNWLKEKYQTSENVQKAWQTFPVLSLLPENNLLMDSSKWNLELHQNAQATIKIDKDLVVINVNKITPTPWHINMRYTGIPVTTNVNYILTFTAKANKEMPLGLTLQQAYVPWDNLGFSETVNLHKDYQDFSIPFSIQENCLNAKIAFFTGFSTGKIQIKNIILKTTDKVSTTPEENKVNFGFSRPLFKLRNSYSQTRIKDIENFYLNLEKNYFTEMTTFLKNTIGTQIPITGIGGYPLQENLISQQNCDFIDKHAYWDHPQFPNKPWDNNDFIMHNESIFSNQSLGFIELLTQSTSPNKAYTVTEWNHCYPNQFSYETPVLLASKGFTQNWDGIFQYSFSHQWQTQPQIERINSFFDICANPQQLLLCAIASNLYLNTSEQNLAIQNNYYNISTPNLTGIVGTITNISYSDRNILIKPQSNGAIFLFSPNGTKLEEANNLILVTISQIKDRGAEWKNHVFHWGNNGILLQRLPITIELSLGKKFRVFELDSRGTIGKEIPVTFQNKKTTFNNQKNNSPWYILQTTQP